MSDARYGILRFDDLAAVSEKTLGTPLEQAWELLASLSSTPIAPLRSQSTVDWPQITECIRTGTRYSMMAKRPDARISLIFDPTAPEDGSYTIRGSLGHRNESGKVLAVTAVEDDGLADLKLSMLTTFPNRFLIITRADDRVGTQKMWRIGISSCRVVSPSD